MSKSSWVETLISSQVAGAALTNTTTATSILPAQAKFLMPAGLISTPGQEIRITASGVISTVVTSPGTLTLDVRFGSTIVMTSSANALNIVAKTNVPWFLTWTGTARAVGATANLMPAGMWTSEANIGSAAPAAGGATTAMLPNAAPVVGTNFDSTAAQIVDMFATWGTANAANSITLYTYRLELLN